MDGRGKSRLTRRSLHRAAAGATAAGASVLAACAAPGASGGVNKRFMAATPNVTVERMTPTAGQERHQKFETALAGGEPPDLFWMDAGRTGDFREKKILLPLDPLIKRDRFDLPDFFPWFEDEPFDA